MWMRSLGRTEGTRPPVMALRGAGTPEATLRKRKALVWDGEDHERRRQKFPEGVDGWPLCKIQQRGSLR